MSGFMAYGVPVKEKHPVLKHGSADTLEESAIIPDALAHGDHPRGALAGYYKSLKHGQLPTHAPSSVGAWVPGEWREVAGPLKMCANGLHACTLDQLIDWLDEEVWTFEYAPGTEVLAGDNKHVGRVGRIIAKTRWGPVSAALFAADCAEHVLYIFEDAHPGDDRPRQAIAAAYAAATDAGGAADAAAAAAAAYAAYAAGAAGAAAHAAHAAGAAGAAASADEHQWQIERLRFYLHEWSEGEDNS